MIDYFGYDDGIYAMMRLFAIMHETGKSLDELFKIFPKKFSSPEIRIECPEEKKKMIVESKKNVHDWKNAEVIAIDGVRVDNCLWLGHCARFQYSANDCDAL